MKGDRMPHKQGTSKPARAAGGLLGHIEDRSRQLAVMEAISSFDLAASPAWTKHDDLASATAVEAMEAVPEGLFETGDDTFRAVATVYVSIPRSGKRSYRSALTEELPAVVAGHFAEGSGDPVAVVDEVEVDTSLLSE